MDGTILVVDDQYSVRQLLEEYLSEQGFQVITATDGQEALYTARRQTPDLILLDLMMPHMDGYQFLRLFRKESTIPVIIITSSEKETDAVTGFNLGADDYITKPFRMRELLARIRAMFRRVDYTPKKEAGPMRAGDILLDKERHQVVIKGENVWLTPIEFDLLAIMMQSPGQVFSRTQLVDCLENSGFNGLERTINVHIRNLRSKIESDPANPDYVKTVFGIGYRFQDPD